MSTFFVHDLNSPILPITLTRIAPQVTRGQLGLFACRFIVWQVQSISIRADTISIRELKVVMRHSFSLSLGVAVAEGVTPAYRGNDLFLVKNSLFSYLSIVTAAPNSVMKPLTRA
jgi:hypothetical protein